MQGDAAGPRQLVVLDDDVVEFLGDEEAAREFAGVVRAR
jgi:hypothetical protein